MKVLVKEDITCWINGVQYEVKQGVQDLEDHLAELLINIGKAEPVEEKDDKRRRG